jgi:hypothetical protein
MDQLVAQVLYAHSDIEQIHHPGFLMRLRIVEPLSIGSSICTLLSSADRLADLYRRVIETVMLTVHRKRASLCDKCNSFGDEEVFEHWLKRNDPVKTQPKRLRWQVLIGLICEE